MSPLQRGEKGLVRLVGRMKASARVPSVPTAAAAGYACVVAWFWADLAARTRDAAVIERARRAALACVLTSRWDPTALTDSLRAQIAALAIKEN